MIGPLDRLVLSNGFLDLGLLLILCWLGCWLGAKQRRRVHRRQGFTPEERALFHWR